MNPLPPHLPLQVKLDSSGNRDGMDVFFCVAEDSVVDSCLYVSGTEVAHFSHAIGREQVRRFGVGL